jgi:Protein of unknown function (DUF5672)
VLIEVGCSPFIRFCVANFVHYLAPGWKHYIVCSHANVEWILAQLPKEVLEKITLIRCCAGPKFDAFPRDYNRLLYNPVFYNNIQGEKILVYHTDAFLRRPLDESVYLQYDWIGSPWCHKLYGGNGGLAIRSKSACLRALQQAKEFEVQLNHEVNEDEWFCDILRHTGTIAPRDLSRSFSVESVWHDNPVGCHKPWHYLTPEQIAKLFELELK